MRALPGARRLRVNPDGTYTVEFGGEVILCRLETADALAGGSLHKPWQKYWVAEWKKKRAVIAPEDAFDLTDAHAEAAFRLLVFERLGLTW